MHHQPSIITFTLLIIFTILSVHVPNSSTTSNENREKLERYLPVNENDILSTNERFKQIMQGSTSSTDNRWKDPRHTIEKTDIKMELQKLNYSHIYQPDWPKKDRKLGAVAAVSFDKNGNVVIFHRVDRIWNGETFNATNHFQLQHLGAIPENTVLAYDRKTGEIVYEWGKNLFYMPHGLTIDNEDNIWITDVALHQVFKFSPKGSSDNKALLTLGTAMRPGHNKTQFCKPTSVAILENGDFFVADGYCNARIMKFSKNGDLLLVWGQNTFHGEAYEYSPMNFFAIPHALTLVPELGLICVADRENGRVQCFFSNNGTAHSQYHNDIIGDRLFSVAYASVSGGQLYVVNGPVSPPGPHKVSGFVIDMKTQTVLSQFAPNNTQFSNPHDIAVTMDGNEVYVAELDPNRIHKFVATNLINKVPNSRLPLEMNKPLLSGAVKPTATIPDELSESDAVNQNKLIPKNSPRPGSTALLVIILLLIFGLVTFGMVVLISRRRKRGCLIFRMQNRRHAWDFPSSKSDNGFKLGNLLGNERKHRFEKLNQNASDEEQDSTTSILATSAQYA